MKVSVVKKAIIDKLNPWLTASFVAMNTISNLMLWLLLWAFVYQTNAQSNGIIKGMVSGAEDAYYSVFLKRASDSNLVKVEFTNLKGEYTFEQIAYNQYFLEIRTMQELLQVSDTFSLLSSILTLPNFVIQPGTKKLKEVKIVQSKPLVERKPDKIVFNVENSLESPANDALVVLQKAPGITVDQQGNISMRGKRGVLVMIDGKPTYLQGAQLANLLRGTTASQIAKIEVISNPSSKYDAEGNAGIVNIVLKKNQKTGSNGVIVLSGGYGRFRKSGNGINVNIKGRKANLFASYNLSNNQNFNDLHLYRKLYQSGVYQGAYRQENYLLFTGLTNTVKVGVDYHLTPKTTLGTVGQAGFSSLRTTGDNICFIENPLGMDISSYTSINRSLDRTQNASINLYTQTKLDSSGTELNTDFDYVQYNSYADQRFTTRYFNLNQQPIQSDYLLHGRFKGQLYILSGKLDFTKMLFNNIKWEAGGKSSYVKANNNLGYYDVSVLPSFDSNLSNHFMYTEQINALYTTFSKEYKSTSIQLGCRAEQTIAYGKQLLNDQSFKRNYWQLFPTFFLAHTLSENHQLGLSMSRRIQRPGYDLMNPVRLFIDATTYKVGNPYLVPQNSYLMELSHTYRQRYLTTLSFTYINKSITEVLIPDETQTNIILQTNKNVNKQFLYSVNVSFPVKLYSWWNANLDATAYHTLYRGQITNNMINSGTTSFNAKVMNRLTLPKQYAAQVDAFFQYGERYSFSSIQPFGDLNISVQKTLNNKRTTFKVSANDVLYTSRFRGSSTFRDYHETYYVQRDSRNIVVSITHKYGKSSVPGMKKRGGGADEEKQRTGKNV